MSGGTRLSFMSAHELPMAGCRKKLLTLWLGLGGGTLLLLAIRSILGIYGSATEEIWSWFLPNIVPTASLMMGVIAIDEREGNDARASGYLFRLAYGLSLVYLGMLLALVLLESFYLSGPNMLEMMKNGGHFMGAFQGIIAATIARFFTKR